MTSKAFRNKLVKTIENAGNFVTDTIEMEAIKLHSKEFGFDEVIYVAGENENEVFLVHIQKIK